MLPFLTIIVLELRNNDMIWGIFTRLNINSCRCIIFGKIYEKVIHNSYIITLRRLYPLNIIEKKIWNGKKKNMIYSFNLNDQVKVA